MITWYVNDIVKVNEAEEDNEEPLGVDQVGHRVAAKGACRENSRQLRARESTRNIVRGVLDGIINEVVRTEDGENMPSKGPAGNCQHK